MYIHGSCRGAAMALMEPEHVGVGKENPCIFLC